jgi:phage recombination protein Bet
MTEVLAIKREEAPSNVAVMPRRKLIEIMAERWHMDPDKFAAAIIKVAMPAGFSNEEFAACLMVAHRYDLDPITKQIYFMKTRAGTIQPIVSVDGWSHIVNRDRNHDGMDFVDHADDKGRLTSITCRIYRKDRSKAVEVTEYMDECRGDSPAWKKTPARMLRHRAMMQCARYAYGIAGVMDADEFSQWQSAQPIALSSEADTDAAPRKSAAESKRDGTADTFNEIRKEISEAISIEMLDHVISNRDDDLATMPRKWAQLVQDDYEVKAEALKKAEAA